jgi:hypothetical protein
VILRTSQHGLRDKLLDHRGQMFTYPKLASCQLTKNRRAVRQSRLVAGERYVAPTSANMCMAADQYESDLYECGGAAEGRCSQTKKMPLAARDQLVSRRRLSEHKDLHSHHHILTWLRFSRALNVVTPGAGCSPIADEVASEETFILRRWRS